MSRRQPETLEEHSKALQARIIRLAFSAHRAGWGQRVVWTAFVRFAEKNLAR